MHLQRGFACYDCQTNYTLRKIEATYSRTKVQILKSTVPKPQTFKM